MDKKTLLGVAALAAFLLVWQNFIVHAIPEDYLYKKAPPQIQEKSIDPIEKTQAETIEPSAPESTELKKQVEEPDVHASTSLPEQIFEVQNDSIKATFSSKGGALTDLEVKNYHPHVNDPSALVLIHQPSFLLDASRSDMQGELTDTDEGQTLTFWNAKYKAIYKFPKIGYNFDLEVHRLDGGKVEIQLTDLEHDPSSSHGGVNHGNIGAVAHLKSRSYRDNSTAIDIKQLAEKSHQYDANSGELIYAGFRNKYFTVFIEPTSTNTSPHQINFSVDKSIPTLHLIADQGSALKYDIYAGPLDKGHLYAKDSEKYGPLFNYTGINVIIHFLLWLLDVYNSIPGINMGVAIMLLTLTVKVTLFPLNLKAQSSMFMMSKIGPELKALQEKHKNDRQQQGVEQMKLFKENGVNPMAGCLPMVIQMPVMISLFSTVGEGFSLRHANFIGWIKDLSAPDRFMSLHYDIPFLGNGDGTTNLNLLVIFYIVTMLIQQSMMPKSTDPQQVQMQKMMKFMMMGFAFLLYNYSSGLMLYFVGSNTLGMAESWYIRNRVLPAIEKKRGKK